MHYLFSDVLIHFVLLWLVCIQIFLMFFASLISNIYPMFIRYCEDVDFSVIFIVLALPCHAIHKNQHLTLRIRRISIMHQKPIDFWINQERNLAKWIQTIYREMKEVKLGRTWIYPSRICSNPHDFHIFISACDHWPAWQSYCRTYLPESCALCKLSTDRFFPWKG